MAWMSKPIVQELTRGRLHLQHGPIDIVLKAWGPRGELGAAHDAVIARFATILDECVSDLGELRRPMADAPAPSSRVGLRMIAACSPFVDVFITPMAAVAGAVADELMRAMTGAARLSRAYVNNGGDIAIHLTEAECFTLGIAGDFGAGEIARANGSIRIAAGAGVGGVATSGAHGRSFSLGIADAVTVLAQSAALADAAATVIANAVDVDAGVVSRKPARELDPDSDLGDMLVTTGVGALSAAEVELALKRGLQRAEMLIARGVIASASLMLRGAVEIANGETMLVRTAEKSEVPV